MESDLIRARAFEDNQGVFYLATNQRLTSRTKYYTVKWHWWQLGTVAQLCKFAFLTAPGSRTEGLGSVSTPETPTHCPRKR